MIKPVVSHYAVISELEITGTQPKGSSESPKPVIFHILPDNSKDVSVLDIGFGAGHLGEMIKQDPRTAHWSVDGVDGWSVNCNNAELFGKKIYRNVWHGLAQELPAEAIRGYDIICLLDVIEHLDAQSAKQLLKALLQSMGDEAFLFISTPLWFYPQDSIDAGDLEQHLIGVPASSMMALCPVMYAVNRPLIGGFVLDKSSLELVEFFHPTADRDFNYEKGLRVADAIRLQYQPRMLYSTHGELKAEMDRSGFQFSPLTA